MRGRSSLDDCRPRPELYSKQGCPTLAVLGTYLTICASGETSPWPQTARIVWGRRLACPLLSSASIPGDVCPDAVAKPRRSEGPGGASVERSRFKREGPLMRPCASLSPLRSFLMPLAFVILVTGCVTVPITGRTQLNMVSDQQLAAAADQNFSKFMG